MWQKTKRSQYSFSAPFFSAFIKTVIILVIGGLWIKHENQLKQYLYVKFMKPINQPNEKRNMRNRYKKTDAIMQKWQNYPNIEKCDNFCLLMTDAKQEMWTLIKWQIERLLSRQYSLVYLWSNRESLICKY